MPTSTITDIALRYACPGIGAIICQLMWTAPLKSVREARKNGRLGDLNPTPWAVMTGNCIAWVSYSFIIKNYFVFFGNATGFIISLWLNMNAIKLLYHDYRVCNDSEESTFDKGIQKTEKVMVIDEDIATLRHSSVLNKTTSLETCEDGNNDEEKVTPRMNKHASILLYGDYRIGNNKSTDIKSDSCLSDEDITKDKTTTHHKNAVTESKQEILFISMVTIWTALLFLLVFIPTTLQQKQLVVGIAANINLCFFYGAPLSTIYAVITTRSSATVHRQTMIMNTLNGMFWCAYGIYVADMIIAVPNGLGALLGFVQGFLCMVFPRNL